MPPTSATDGPGAPTLRGLGTSKHTPAEGLTRRWAEGPANCFFEGRVPLSGEGLGDVERHRGVVEAAPHYHY